jgi:GAF domain-containing protein
MKLRRQLAIFFPFLGEAIGGHPATPNAPVDAHGPPAMDRSVSLESRREIAIRELLEICARSFVPHGRHVRANMMTFSPDKARRQVHAATAYNMEHDPDRDLEIGATAAASGKAVSERRAAVADLGLLRITATPAWGLTTDEQVRVRPTLMSILSVPIFNPEDIDGALLGSLQVDSDLTVEEAGFTKPESAELLQQFADLLSLLLIGVHVRVADIKFETVRTAPNSRVQNASQVEPGLYVANRSTSIFQLSTNRYS